MIVKATACHCVDCLSVLCSGKEEEVGRGHVGSEQLQGRPSVMEKQSKERKKEGVGGWGGGGFSHLARQLDSRPSSVSLMAVKGQLSLMDLFSHASMVQGLFIKRKFDVKVD